jgi:uncharacterized protein (TIGR02145 family)
MVDIRGFNGGMNTDAAPELLKSGDYTYAMNVSNGTEGITNLLGNRLLPGMPPNPNPGGEWICGAFFDKARQRIIYFTNHERTTHRIISFDVPSVQFPDGNYTVLFEDLFGVFSYWDSSAQFDPNSLIKDIKVVHREYEGDLYYFIDPKKRLLKFNYNTLLQRRSGNTQLCAFGWTDANYTGTTFRNGDIIPQVSDPTAWSGLTTPAWCYYDNNQANDAIYGKLYNWYAINDPRGFAPFGYRVPTDTDWTSLSDCLGGVSVAGGKMKSTSSLWTIPNTGATNESFLNALPGGEIDSGGGFNSVGFTANFWSATEFNANNAYYRNLSYSSDDLLRSNFSKKFGCSVRLIKE